MTASMAKSDTAGSSTKLHSAAATAAQAAPDMKPIPPATGSARVANSEHITLTIVTKPGPDDQPVTMQNNAAAVR
ncbi:hypothetical protein PE143B_0100300 [Pseudomonas extremaustralis 14-3 substr. 14-3b]|nr:hypothetical protein PE143B_0100300 [Pseudomonas extremaustralis 14-3 substr. 14-3b]